jgi:hypothetical protein
MESKNKIASVSFSVFQTCAPWRQEAILHPIEHKMTYHGTARKPVALNDMQMSQTYDMVFPLSNAWVAVVVRRIGRRVLVGHACFSAVAGG